MNEETEISMSWERVLRIIHVARWDKITSHVLCSVKLICLISKNKLSKKKINKKKINYQS